MFIDFLRSVFREYENEDAVVWQDRTVPYGWLSEEIERQLEWLSDEDVESGSVVSLEADFSPRAVATLLALIERGTVVVPLSSSVDVKKPEFRSTAQVEVMVRIEEDEEPVAERTDRLADHEIYQELRGRGHPGLVLFSSGSTGKSKAAVHDLVPLLEKFHVRRKRMRMITFLLFDHIGGVNTLLYVLSNGGCVVTVPDRSPDGVCHAIEKHRAQILPTSPTFLNLLLLSEAYARHDLSSLELVTYGTEVMPESTLKRCRELFPDVRFLQTYGLSELGILRSKSRSSDSLWVKVGGEGFETRVVDGLLEIRAKSAMLGYLNAESPFTEDGWFRTGDMVEVDGEYLRILGRDSEIINVGGEKVYPAEVESVLQDMPGVAEAVVRGEPNPITGNVVAARVRLKTPESQGEFRKRMRGFCSERLPRFKIPQKVELSEESMHGSRFKKMR